MTILVQELLARAKERNEEIDRLKAENAKLIEANTELKAAVERAAQRIYETWSDSAGYVPWVQGGNSMMQQKAWRIAMGREQP